MLLQPRRHRMQNSALKHILLYSCSMSSKKKLMKQQQKRLSSPRTGSPSPATSPSPQQRHVDVGTGFKPILLRHSLKTSTSSATLRTRICLTPFDMSFRKIFPGTPLAVFEISTPKPRNRLSQGSGHRNSPLRNQSSDMSPGARQSPGVSAPQFCGVGYAWPLKKLEDGTCQIGSDVIAGPLPRRIEIAPIDISAPLFEQAYINVIPCTPLTNLPKIAVDSLPFRIRSQIQRKTLSWGLRVSLEVNGDVHSFTIAPSSPSEAHVAPDVEAGGAIEVFTATERTHVRVQQQPAIDVPLGVATQSTPQRGHARAIDDHITHDTPEVAHVTRAMQRVRMDSPGSTPGSPHAGVEKDRVPEENEAALPSITFADVGGLQQQITEVRRLIETPLHRPEVYYRHGLKPPKGVLLYGPPGTGKTLIARALAAETHAAFMVINGAEVMSAYVGESEQKLRGMFREAEARAPCIVFIDEVDALCPRRDETNETEARVVATLLSVLDGVPGDRIASRASPSPVTAPSSAVSGDGQFYTRGQEEGTLASPRVVVLAATNRPDALDPALRRPGRLDREIEIGIPKAEARADILFALLRKVPHTLTSPEISAIAETAHGFVGADLAAVVKEASLAALRRVCNLKGGSIEPLPSPKSLQLIDAEGTTGQGQGMEADDVIGITVREVEAASSSLKEFSRVVRAAEAEESKQAQHTHDLSTFSVRVNEEEEQALTFGDVREAMKHVRPSALREVRVDIPKVHWSDIGGNEEIKQGLIEAVEWPFKHAQSFQRMDIQPPKGILLYGPPGCSKTLCAKAIATESSMNFLSVKGPELLSKYVGDSEKAVANIFARARAASPCVIFFDEFDALGVSRSGGQGGGVYERVVSQLLCEMDGLGSSNTLQTRVLVVAATNRPDIIDSALLRPGRIDRLIYVGLPDTHTREHILTIEEQLKGYTGAECVSVLQQSAVAALSESLSLTHIHTRHVETAVAQVKPQIGELQLGIYRRFLENSKL